MVALTEAIASNQRISSTFPKGLVAVFVGGTSGIGEYTIKAFAKYTHNSRAYIIGRSEPNAKRIMAECRTLGPSSTFEFIQGDISLLKTIDEICKKIRAKETAINILFQTQYSIAFSKVTSEGLSFIAALGMYSRTRFILNLLPLLQNATTLKRVVCVMAATTEGPIDLDNLGGISFPNRKRCEQLASAQTLLLEKIQEKFPEAADIGFVHDGPGVVQSGITRDAEGLGMKILIGVTNLLGPWIRTPIDECSEMHLFYATSARFASGNGGGSTNGVPLQNGLEVARGSIGKVGSGVYTIDNKGEPSPPSVNEVLAGHHGDGTANKLWDIIMAESKKITGSEWLA